jgi:hypothetical protein
VQSAPTLPPETRLQALGEFICGDPRRALSWIVFAAGVVLLSIRPQLACRFMDLLTRAERRHAWTRSLLY